jgi:hypothetical protein
VSTTPTRPQALTAVRRGADTAFGYLAALFVLAVLAQVFLAGVGAFAFGNGSPGFAPHEDLGNVLGIVAVVLFVMSLVSRATRAQWIGALVLALLTELAQHGLAAAGSNNVWIGGIQPFDGMLILLLALWLSLTTLRRNGLLRR